MKLDLSSFAYNMDIRDGGATPAWGTALGQGNDYKLTIPGVDELITSMVYSKIDERLVNCPLGKGGHSPNYTYELASLYKKIYVNDTLIPGARYILLIVKQTAGENHIGRRTLKYSPNITYSEQPINADCIRKITTTLGLNDNSAWFVSSIYTKNQDELHFNVIVANENEKLIFDSTDERKDFMLNLLNESTDNNDIIEITGGYNKIYYGIPGSGKSYKVDEEFNKESYFIERTTFHPEYTNSDFIGQIIPMVKENKVEYIFHPGAFTLALKYALENKTEKICLIIEEINRGNSSAIFGDIFQLLDRDENGKSKYKIYNGPILDYLKENGIDLKEIYIPSNMWIVATMNTCDQNVFTLDTAFKRRWKMEYIRNVFADNDKSMELKKKVIPLGDKYPDVTWEEFVNKINKHIISDTSGINGEDKQLGMYFVSIEEIDNRKEFAEKILSYLWEDVAKLNPSYWFGQISSYEELIDSFTEKTLDVFNSLFEDKIKKNDENPNENIGE